MVLCQLTCDSTETQAAHDRAKVPETGNVLLSWQPESAALPCLQARALPAKLENAMAFRSPSLDVLPLLDYQGGLAWIWDKAILVWSM